MKSSLLALCVFALPALAQQMAQQTGGQPTPQTMPPPTMTKMVVRLMGPGIKPGSFAALPKTIYRAGNHYSRIEDPPDARQHVQKLMIVVEPDAYSVNLIDRQGTHAIDGGGPNDLHLPIVLPFDSQHRLGKLDRLEFGAEYDLFEAAGAEKQAGPLINAKPTGAYQLQTPQGPARLTVRAGTKTPVFLTWQTADGTYKYEYISFEELPFEASLFAKPGGIRWKEMRPDPKARPNDR